MIRDIHSDRYVDRLVKLEITPTEDLLLHLIHTKQYALLYKCKEEGEFVTAELFDSLIRKGYLIDLNKNGERYFDATIVSDDYIDKMYNEDEFVPGEEVWEVYPTFIIIDQRRISLKNTSKFEFVKEYYKKIGRYKDLHEDVLKAIEYGKKHEIINMSITNFFQSQVYEDILKEMRSKRNPSSNNNPQNKSL